MSIYISTMCFSSEKNNKGIKIRKKRSHSLKRERERKYVCLNMSMKISRLGLLMFMIMWVHIYCYDLNGLEQAPVQSPLPYHAALGPQPGPCCFRARRKTIDKSDCSFQWQLQYFSGDSREESYPVHPVQLIFFCSWLDQISLKIFFYCGEGDHWDVCVYEGPKKGQ
jgi:hypothetical protein